VKDLSNSQVSFSGRAVGEGLEGGSVEGAGVTSRQNSSNSSIGSSSSIGDSKWGGWRARGRGKQGPPHPLPPPLPSSSCRQDPHLTQPEVYDSGGAPHAQRGRSGASQHQGVPSLPLEALLRSRSGAGACYSVCVRVFLCVLLFVSYRECFFCYYVCLCIELIISACLTLCFTLCAEL
jgi:hypothetical protein